MWAISAHLRYQCDPFYGTIDLAMGDRHHHQGLQSDSEQILSHPLCVAAMKWLDGALTHSHHTYMNYDQ